MARGPIFEHVYQVEEWCGGQPIRLIAGCDNMRVARAAYDAAVANYPHLEILLRNGTLVDLWTAQDDGGRERLLGMIRAARAFAEPPRGYTV